MVVFVAMGVRPVIAICIEEGTVRYKRSKSTGQRLYAYLAPSYLPVYIDDGYEPASRIESAD